MFRLNAPVVISDFFCPDDAWSIQLRRQQVIFQTDNLSIYATANWEATEKLREFVCCNTDFN